MIKMHLLVSLGIGAQLKDAYKMITSTMIIDTVIRKNYTTLFLAITYKGYVFFFIRYCLKKNNITNNVDYMEQTLFAKGFKNLDRY